MSGVQCSRHGSQRAPLACWLRVASVSAVFQVATIAGPAYSQDVTNALWNDSNSDSVVGFWVYPLSGECSSLRLKAKPLVFALRRTSGREFSVGDLKYCFQLPERAGTPLIQCRSGGGRVSFDASTRRYDGEYSFQMTDGTRREGAFVAQFCPPAGESDTLPQRDSKSDYSTTRFGPQRDGRPSLRNLWDLFRLRL